MRNGPRGTLILVTGADEAPAEAVVEAAQRCRGLGRVVFPRRVVSGPPMTCREIHQTVTGAQFEELRRNGAFAVVWGSNGRNYGLPARIAGDLRAGRIVVAAATAAALPAARRALGPLTAAVLGGAAEVLSGCDEIIDLPADPREAGFDLAAHLRELAAPSRRARRAAAPWIGGSPA